MQDEVKNLESVPPEVQDVMRSLIAGIRAVKLYPPNNPVYSQAVKKSYEVLDHFLKTAPEYPVGVLKTYFTYLHTPVGKDAQLNRAIAQDLFAKGVRKIVFSDGVTEDELLELYRALALSPEDMAMKSGIASILWEKGATHINVTEAGLDEVITTQTEGGWEAPAYAETPAGVLDPSTAKKEIAFAGRTLVLGDLVTDPAGFGAGMVELAQQTRGEHESTEDRLFALYHEAGRKIREERPDQSDTLFEGLAKSVLSLEPPYREGLIAGKLYAEMDSETVNEQKVELEEQVPNELHEILTGRFSNAWTVQQVTALLKKTSAKKITPPSPPTSPASLDAVPVPRDLLEIVKDLAEYTPEEMEELKTMSEVGMESDIIEAAVRTLIFLLPLVKNPDRSAPKEKEINLFSGVVHQLEDMLGYLLKKKDYDLAALIVRVFHMPVDPVFKPRMTEAIKKTASRAAIATTISDLQKFSKGSPEYVSAYSYLSTLEREATEVLLEILAEETDRSARVFLLDLLKDLGKNQLALIGDRLSDDRWYVVRNIVSILGESKTNQAIAFLQKAADHKDVRIRQEVIKGLISIGGKKAAGLLAKFLNDKDAEIQLMAIRGLTESEGVGAEEAKPLVAFLEDLPLKMKEREFTIEAIKALAKIGGPDAGESLKRYTRIRWWKPRKLQVELRAAALWAMEEIKRREGDGGRARR
jgi:HEAT repeat protein